MSRGVEVRGSVRTLAFRAPSAFFRERRLNSDDGLPGAAKNTGDDAYLRRYTAKLSISRVLPILAATSTRIGPS